MPDVRLRAQREVTNNAPMMTEDDQAKLKAIFVAADDWTRVALMAAYWRDVERAERTDRGELSLHLEMALGMCARLLEQLRRTQRLGGR